MTTLIPIEEGEYRRLNEEGQRALLRQKTEEIGDFIEAADVGIEFQYKLDQLDALTTDLLDPIVEDESVEGKHDKIVAAIEQLNFERWRRDQLMVRGIGYTYQPLVNVATLNQPAPTVTARGAGVATIKKYLKAVYAALQPYDVTPVTVDTSGKQVVLNFATLLAAIWPLDSEQQENLDESIKIDNVTAKTYTTWTVDARRVAMKVMEWRANYTIPLSIPSDLVRKGATLDVVPTRSGEAEPTTVPSSTTTTQPQPQPQRPVVEPTPKSTPVPSSTPPARAKEPVTTSVTNSNVMALEEAVTNLEAELDLELELNTKLQAELDEANLKNATLRTNIGKAIDDVKTANERAASLVEANNRLIKEKRQLISDAVACETELAEAKTLAQAVQSGSSDATQRLQAKLTEVQTELDGLKKQLVYHVVIDNTKQALYTNEETESLRIWLNDNPPVAYGAFRLDEIEQLVAAYNALLSKRAPLLNVKDYVQLQRFESLARAPSGSVRLLVKTRDPSGAEVGTMEILRLAPQSLPSGERKLVADLRDPSLQVAHSGGRYNNVVPRAGSVTVRVSELGQLRGEYTLSYDTTAGYRQSQSANNDVSLYTSPLGDTSAQLNVIAVKY